MVLLLGGWLVLLRLRRSTQAGLDWLVRSVPPASCEELSRAREGRRQPPSTLMDVVVPEAEPIRRFLLARPHQERTNGHEQLARSTSSATATMLVPPNNFGMVEEDLYRSGAPDDINLPFLAKLQLKSLIWLAPEEPGQELWVFSPKKNAT